MIKLLVSGLTGVILLTTTSIIASPVTSVQLETGIKNKSQIPVIIVGSNGERYTHIKSSHMKVPVRITASCRGKHTLARTQVTVGKFSITGGHMRKDQHLAMQEFRTPVKSKHMPWESHMFTVSVTKLNFRDSMNPIKACNSFLNSRTSNGMRRQFFMSKDRRMTVSFPISLAAQCKRKWKSGGSWRQTSQPIKAIVICRGRSR
ncbi:hypothetical protein MNBD_GAMMA12-3488 [hydrothermal vent metagenome]|uniref:Uncharacterized protein n=1 Tax=hydrothermal vent metagenome TaxID=652676 RepID=A0A3B0Z4G4_9ZZZZ